MRRAMSPWRIGNWHRNELWHQSCKWEGLSFLATMNRRLAPLLSNRPARPKSAASLVLLREWRGGLEVLLGRRGGGARFMAGKYVFPGGGVQRSDRYNWFGEPNPADHEHRSRLLAHARAALRETFEETGLLIGRHSDALRREWASEPRTLTAVEAAYLAERIVPAVDALMPIGRAITPAASPIRFHAHFFMADAELAVGALRVCGELEDLRWHSVESRELPELADVTRFMLTQAVAARRHGVIDPIPLYRYVQGIPKVTRGAARSPHDSNR